MALAAGCFMIGQPSGRAGRAWTRERPARSCWAEWIAGGIPVGNLWTFALSGLCKMVVPRAAALTTGLPAVEPVAALKSHAAGSLVLGRMDRRGHKRGKSSYLGYIGFTAL